MASARAAAGWACIPSNDGWRRIARVTTREFVSANLLKDQLRLPGRSRHGI
jgi:hypothetical protein